MNQATLIVGAILTAFIAYVAVKGRLGVYYNVVVGSAAASSGSAPAPASSGSTLGIPNSVLTFPADPNSAVGKALLGIF